MTPRLLHLSALTLIAAMAGCASRAPSAPRAAVGPRAYYQTVGLMMPTPVLAVAAQCAPPVGWKAEPLKISDRHAHQVWLSPTGKTAYGVVHFSLPFPVGVNLVHWEFIREMKKHEGEAIEISRQNDPALPGIRFVVDSGLYRMRSNLIVQGFEGWAIYAGTLRREAPVPAELELAERARENTIAGLPDRPASAQTE